VLRQGNVIELKPLNSFDTKKLEVVEACSGIRSLMTLVTLAVVFAYFTYPRSNDSNGPRGRFDWLRSYGFWRSVILVASAVPIAILTNASRVSGTGILSHYYGTGVADGFFHSFSGWAIYIVAFLLLFAVGWVLDRFKPSAAEKNPAEVVTEKSSHAHASVATASSVTPVTSAILFAAIALLWVFAASILPVAPDPRSSNIDQRDCAKRSISIGVGTAVRERSLQSDLRFVGLRRLFAGRRCCRWRGVVRVVREKFPCIAAL
jgi:exosortase/archaeosortase family protein